MQAGHCGQPGWRGTPFWGGQQSEMSSHCTHEAVVNHCLTSVENPRSGVGGGSAAPAPQHTDSGNFLPIFDSVS